MKQRITLIAVAALLLMGAFILIMTRLHSPQEVLSPPNPGGEYRQLQQAFESAAGGATEYKLQYPTEGDYRSAYILHDLDGDGENEALVFYTSNSDESNVRIHMLDNKDDRWVSVSDEAGYGGKINSCSFADLNGDGQDEVVLSWSLIGADSSRTMTVHQAVLPENGKATFQTLSNMPYMAMDVLDMDNDGNPEILLLWNETTNKVPHNYAALMKMTSSGLSQYGEEAELDSTVSVYSDISLQEGKTPVAYADALKGDNSMLTEVLWWDGVNKKLQAPFTDNDTKTNVATLRTPAIPSQDVDNDGILEIPASADLPAGNETTSDEERIPLTAWSVTGTADPGVLTPKAYSYVNTEENLVFRVEPDYRDMLLAYRNTKTGVVTVYSTNDGRTRADPLFSLVVKNTEDMTKSDTYTFLKQQDKRSVFGTLTSAGADEGFTNDSIEQSLSFYETF